MHMPTKAILMSAVVAAIPTPQSVAANPTDAAQAAYNQKDYRTAFKLWLPLASKGDMSAQLAIGEMYFSGTGVKQNYAFALKWLRKAADQGNAEAQGDIGWQYETGHGVAQDATEGRRWFLRSANQGDANGMEYMAESYIPEENEPEIYFWYSLLARSSQAYAESRDKEAGFITADQKAAIEKRVAEWKAVPERP